jgi:DHA2 family multidrug resistance protein
MTQSVARDGGRPPRRDVTETGLRLALIVVGVMAATLMQTLDSTITNVALPTIQGNMGASLDEGTWVVTAYTIAAIVVIPLTPWLQNRFGRKNYFLVSIVGFTLASVACGASSSFPMLVISRVVQGAFGGGLLATAQSILRDTFPPEKLGISQGVFALGAIIGPTLGPPLGGLLVDNASWNWVFDINVIPGTFSAIVLFMLLRDPEDSHATRVDFVGLVLLAAGLGSLQFVLAEGERHDWLQDPTIATMSAICVTSLAAFVWNELYVTDEPIVDLRILRNRSVAAGSILALALGVAIFGSTYTLPQFTQGVLGYTPTLSGALFVIRAVPILLLTPLVARSATKVDARIFLGTGFVLVAAGSAMQGFVTTYEAQFWTFAPALALTGAGAALLFIPLSVAVLGTTTPREGPKASAFVNLALQLGGSIAVAWLDVVIDRRWTLHSTYLGGAQTLANPAVQRFLAQGSLVQLGRIVNGQAAILAYADATFAIAAIAAASTPLILLMRKPKAAAGPIEAGG